MKISIAQCTYNGEAYLAQQLKSFTAQSRQPDELIVIDDRSSDRTLAILNEFALTAPFQTKVYQNETNLGVVANFESALSQTTGDIIFLSDQDDVWERGKIADIVEQFERDPELGMVFTDAEIVDESLNTVGKSLWMQWNLSAPDQKRFEDDPFSFLLTDRNIVTGATAAFSRPVLNASLPFPTKMPILHDGWLALIAAAMWKVRADQTKSLYYRQHTNQVVGIRQFRPDIGKEHYAAHLQQLYVLRERMTERPERSILHTALVDNFIAHLQARLEMPGSLPGRILPVLKELATSRYSRFSSGFRSAAKDLVGGL
jgi:glycosyltransferase involved in cell wall biosynthesis